MVTKIKTTHNPLHTDTRYNDKIHYNDSLTVSKPSLKKKRISHKLCKNIYFHNFITKTCLYNFDPLEPHFYIEKLGFTGVYIILLIFAQNIDCGYSLEPPRLGGSNDYPQSMFSSEIGKISVFFFYLKMFSFWR